VNAHDRGLVAGFVLRLRGDLNVVNHVHEVVKKSAAQADKFVVNQHERRLAQRVLAAPPDPLLA
jgi:hypothetical protein